MKLRVSRRLEKSYQKHRELNKKLREHAEDILNSEKFKSTYDHMQHGSISVHRHSIDVAKQSLMICKKLRLNVNERDLVRGALLHDYFLYDWHDSTRENFKHGHGFYHAKVALKNALNDYELTPIQCEIIKKHMWPLNITPPMCKEAWVVTIADKYCSTLETLRIRKARLSD